MAKILTSGYLPLGAVAISGQVAEPFMAGDGAWLRHGYTYSGHATACAAALANLEIMEEEELVGRVRATGSNLARQLEPLAALDLVTEVRTVGLLAAIQLDLDELERRGVSAADVVRDCRERGQLTRLLASGALQFSPPFIATEAHVETFAGVVGEVISNLEIGTREAGRVVR